MGLLISGLILAAFIKIVMETINLLSNKKIYKISKEHKFRDSIEIIGIFILLMLIITVPFSIHYMISNSSPPCMETRLVVKRSLYNLNQILSLQYAYKEKMPETLDEFSNVFQKRANCLAVYNIKNINDGEIHRIDKEFIKTTDKSSFKIPFFTKETQDIKNKIDEKTAKLPCLQLYSGITYFVNSYKNGCKNYDLENPENSDCWLTVDVNGFKYPNELVNRKLNEKTNSYSSSGDQVIIVIKTEGENNLLAVSPKRYYFLVK